ncbi:MAG TPA: SH3 domain-containing protein [Oculatellaceae cyanobacterium]|jgi:SH3-like domain-containing protein
MTRHLNSKLSTLSNPLSNSNSYLLKVRRQRIITQNIAKNLLIIFSLSCISCADPETTSQNVSTPATPTAPQNVSTPAASPKIANQEKCNIYAYVVDEDPQGLNVRSSPNSNSQILGKIPTQETVNAIASSGNWVKITNASGGYQGDGWVYSSLLGIATRGYDTNKVNIYANASNNSQKLGTIPTNTSIKMLGCNGEWAQVEYQGLRGWLAREDQCGAALTTCP